MSDRLRLVQMRECLTCRMLVQLKSFIVYFWCPLIFLTINFHERYIPIALFYAGDNIEIRKFQSKLYSLSLRLKRTLGNPLAVVEYCHIMIIDIIQDILKEGMFGEMSQYCATMEYHGPSETPHTHLGVYDFLINSSDNCVALD